MMTNTSIQEEWTRCHSEDNSTMSKEFQFGPIFVIPPQESQKLRSSGLTLNCRKACLISAMLYPVVESSLPVEILKAWDRHRLNREVKEDSILTTEKILENLMSFLCHEVEGEEHRVLAETAFGNGIKRKDTHKPVHKDEPTAATLIANSSAGKITVFSVIVLTQVKNVGKSRT
ncbi:transposable element Tc1 transposase [Caerostris extrusa]|uniref:Transposable element Tc1 transposase n=1 Tax=Caerostris extrusa TaxID=172846 RepID=A0AAV4WDQ9_CAEEX|nr:transposable element Tc1 transposase [Caerostris extrusa]